MCNVINYICDIYICFCFAVFPVFVKTGNDLLLDPKKDITPEKGKVFAWTHKSLNIVRRIGDGDIIPHSHYSNRAELFNQTCFVLVLKNVTQSDSGHYYARTSGDENKNIVEYKVTVQGKCKVTINTLMHSIAKLQNHGCLSFLFVLLLLLPDPVSQVNLTVKPSSSCNVTVSCSTIDGNISSTFMCDAEKCSPEGGEMLESAAHPSTITVYLEQDNIICNHSNRVSWHQARERLNPSCKPGKIKICGTEA